ncbi:antichymotrypsin-2-like [Neocloeon triangulifer]|uniref:antichymotrypsin-2-like n=1 Tax=Neocloeon triangulifer TaxID=2078957 RepID=UPI00286F80C1|nr:antichymotrypsin-2-like [Neocloeon triangulifer]XP_059478182.1 antichymotrypsin-2-like [Neocloeon triangulifer]XP_059478183.1 antichymotrypsin-2-like [Neocloeon triangulifer]
MLDKFLVIFCLVALCWAQRRGGGGGGGFYPGGERGAGAAQSKFGEIELQLLKHIYESDPDGGITFSPLSIRTLLAMLSEGAQGKTKTDLEEALGDTRSIRRVLGYSSRGGIAMGNSFYLSNNLNINEAFKEKLTSSYKAEFQYADFSRPRSAAYNINEWVRRITNKGISELISPQSLSPESVFMMVNAIHLTAKWTKKFDSEETVTDGIFYESHSGELKPKLAEMMRNYEHFRYGTVESLNAQVIELPFQVPENHAMYVVLPTDPNGLKDLINKLTPESLGDILKTMNNPIQLTLYLPKFKASTTQNLKTILPGKVAQVFSPSADISGISPDRNIQLSEVLHKANLKVDEEGATGSAATAVQAILLSNTPQIVMNVSHPFLYFIAEQVNERHFDFYSSSNQEIYFMGYVSNLDDSRELPSNWGPLPPKQPYNPYQGYTQGNRRRPGNNRRERQNN